MNPEVDDDVETRAGVPRPGRVPVSVPVPSEPLTPDEPAEPVCLREGETDLGRPPQVPLEVAALSEADRRQLRLAEEAQAAAELAEAEELLATDPMLFRAAGWFAHPLAAAFLAGSAGALGLFLFAQATSILGHLAAQPALVQGFGYAGLALLGGLVIYAVARLLILFVRLERNRQVRVAGLDDLHARTRLRWLAKAKTDEARTRLARYLTTFPIGTPAANRRLVRLGLTPDQIEKLAAARQQLTDPAQFVSSGDWLTRFRTDFQGPLDAAADARVRHWSNRAMLVTAASPNGLVDSLATVYFGFALVADLCQVYHLRAGRTATAVLLGRVFFHAYLAGQMSDVEGLLEGQADQVFEHAFAAVGVGVGTGVASKFLGKVGAKATTGYLNRLLLMRLGKYACRLLRPVA